MNRPIYHHFLPQFYQRRWIGADNRLCRFSKPYGDTVVAKRVAPRGTGGEDYLYSLNGVPAEEAQRIETDFMRPMDTLASDALCMLERGDRRMVSDAKYRSAWSRFILSLLLRMPGDVAALQAAVREEWAARMPEVARKYEELRSPVDPPTLDGYLDALSRHDLRDWALEMAPRLIDHRGIGNVLNNMRWFIRSIDNHGASAAQYLTSDRPVLMVDGLKSPEAVIMLPISPSRLFVAVHNVETQRRFEEVAPEKHIEMVNMMVAGRAAECVYGKDDELLDFVQRHFGTRRRTSLMDRLVAYRRRINGPGSSMPSKTATP